MVVPKTPSGTGIDYFVEKDGGQQIGLVLLKPLMPSTSSSPDCSEPRLAFNRIVVVRCRMYLESRSLAANTINQQLAAVRRLAHEAADAGLLSPELAAGISRVKGVKQLGFRAGNWLSAAQSSEVLQRASGEGMRARRDYAMLAMLFGCGFRRSELVGLELGETQIRQGHWAVVDLIGKGGHIRTVPIPNGSKRRSISGPGQRELRREEYFAQLPGRGRHGGRASRRMWFGTWLRPVARRWVWNTSRRMTCGELARSCATIVVVSLSRFSSC